MNGRIRLPLVAIAATSLGLRPCPAPAREGQPDLPVRAGAGAPSARSIDIEVYENRIYLPVTINGEGPYRFCLDTGAPTTCIDLDLARTLGVLAQDGGRVGGAGEGTTAMGVTSAVRLSLGGEPLRARPVMAIDFTALTQFQGRPLHGLLGNDFFRGRVVEIDYAAGRLTMHPAGFEYGGAGVVLPTRTQAYTIVEALLTPPGGEPLRARCMLDTGAGLALAANTPFVRRHRLAERADRTVRATTGFGLGGEVRQTLCRMEAIELTADGSGSGLRFELPLLGLSNDRAGAFATGQFDLLIGGGFLHKFRVILDGPGRRLILEPNDAYPEPLEFDMSGLTLAASLPAPADPAPAPDSPARAAGLRVMRVVDGSPAAEAGVREGDVLLAIDGDRIEQTDREAVRRRLRQHGAMRRLRFSRDGETFDVTVTLRRLVLAPMRELPRPA